MVVLESDSTEAVEMVMGRCACMREDGLIIQKSKVFLSRHWSINIRHVFHELNKIAHWIARWVAEEEIGVFELS